MKIVCIFGSSAVAYHKPEWGDLWSCNGLHVRLQTTPHSWFQIHDPAEIYELEKPDHIAWLEQPHDFPVYTKEESTFPSSRRFPKELTDTLWKFPTEPSYSCSFSYMVALAMWQQYDAMVLRGITLTTPRENWLEVPNLMLWLGLAAGVGMVVDMDGRLMESYYYGSKKREIPKWAPTELINDLIVDNIKEARTWRDRHNQASRDSGAT